MKRRQTLPRQWLIIDGRPTAELWRTIQDLRRGSGVLLLAGLSANERRRLRHLANMRGLTVAQETRGEAARVHNIQELRAALRRRTPLILLSPIHRTASHPDWLPMPRFRAAAFARLARRKAVALGGMNQKQYARIAPLGFIGWAGISAFRT
jgi:thiamine monophosphate synthase